VGAKPVEDYCREIETYLCRKNDGHLIRVVGPSFDLVSAWAAQGIPLKVAFRGIDRYFERYYRSCPRRRPVRIDFCEADILDVFHEWRRAIGLPASRGESSAPLGQDGPGRASSSLPSHLERALMRLSQARATGSIGPQFDNLIERVAGELDLARAGSRGVRGEARQSLLGRLAALDVELAQTARASLDHSTLASLVREADGELAEFRPAMAPEAFARAREAAIDRLVRERCGLPTLSFS